LRIFSWATGCIISDGKEHIEAFCLADGVGRLVWLLQKDPLGGTFRFTFA